MEILKIICLSLGSIITLFILTKLMGNRELSQLTTFDYINSITIGSIAAEMATSLEDNFWEPLIAMIVYAIFIILVSLISSKSIKARRILSGSPLVLYENGTFYRENFKKSKIDLSDFFIQCRSNGYFNIADIQSAILEPNGKISFLPLSLKRPATPEDLNLQPPIEKPTYNIVIDGCLLEHNLKAIGRDHNWLDKQLKQQKVDKISDIYLATFDNSDNLSIYLKCKKSFTTSAFE